MAEPQHDGTGQRQSLTATGASPPPLGSPNRDTTTTLNPSVTNSLPSTGTDSERMVIEDEAPNELANQFASTDLSLPKDKGKAPAESEHSTQETQPSQHSEPSQRRQTPDPIDAIMAGTDEAAKQKLLQDLKRQWRKADRPNCPVCGHSHPPPCDPDKAAERRRLQELKDLDPDAYNREIEAKAAARQQKQDANNAARTEEVHASIIAAGQTPNKLKSSGDATRRQQVNFADSIANPQAKKNLPPDWCMQCLACHPFKSKQGTYHIRTYKKNLALHKMISLGQIPKVDPWAELVKEFKPPSPKPAPLQAPEQQELCTGTWKASADVDRYFDKLSECLNPFQKIQAFNMFLRGHDEYQDQRTQSAMQAPQAPATQQFGSYATAATTGGYNSHYPLPTEPRPQAPQPTGPPPKKKRKAGNTNEQSERADKSARFGGSHTAIMQGAGGQRTNAAHTPQPTAKPASDTDQRQRDSSNQLEKVQHTSQTKSLRISNMPTTAGPSKTLAKGEATAAKKAAEQATAEKAVDDKAPANKAAPNDQNPT